MNRSDRRTIKIICKGEHCHVSSDCDIGDGSTFYHFINVYNGSVFGKNCKIGSYTEISGAVIGNNVRIGAYSFIPDGVTIHDDAIIGPGVHFTHEFPPLPKGEWAPIVVECGAMIGTKAIIMPGVTVGEKAIIGAGSVITKSVPPGETWAGVPARKLETKQLPASSRGAAISAVAG
jgi:acetyltransferase-like isoleucine patch superfamily enzyme